MDSLEAVPTLKSHFLHRYLDQSAVKITHPSVLFVAVKNEHISNG